MKGSSIFKATVCLSGWAVAAWLLLAGPLEPIALPASKERGTAMPPPSTGNPIESTFLGWSADPALAGSLVGFCVLDESGKTVFASPLAGKALCPASALKTVTTAAALEIMGPDFTFWTGFTSGWGLISPDGILEGDLFLEGRGDPTLSIDDLDAMVASLVRSGLKQVNGRLSITEPTRFEVPVNDHWNWGDIGNSYGAGAYGLNVDHNRISIRFQPGVREGDPAILLNRGAPTKDTRWVNQVLTGPPGSGDRVVVYSEPRGRIITLRGTVPAGEDGFTVNGALPDPPAFALEFLNAKFEAAGVKFLGRESQLDLSWFPVLAGHRSKELVEIVDHIHKVSDNLEAQCLFLSLGPELQRDPSEVLESHWESRGVSFTGLRLIDGSGLARANMIRPLDLAMVNHLARRGPHGERFRQSLTTYLDGKVRSKLGAMSGVRTEVGFLTLEDGREVTFALLANGLDLKVDFWPLRERLLREVASKLARQ